MEKQGKIAWHFWVGVTFLLLSISGIILVPYQVLEPNIGVRSIAFAPSTFPYVSLSFVALFSIIMVLQRAFRKPTASDDAISSPSMRVLVPMAIFLFYVFVIEIIGMILSTFIAVAFIALALGNKSWLTILLLSTITSASIWSFFSVLLKVYFPEGTLFEGLM